MDVQRVTLYTAAALRLAAARSHMQHQWRDHTITIKGDWVGRYLYLAPKYELLVDDQQLDASGGPRLRPTLEGIVEDEEGKSHHIKAELLSIFGFRPSCTLMIDDEIVFEDKIRVENILNPFLMLFILGATLVMLYLGPEVLRGYAGKLAG